MKLLSMFVGSKISGYLALGGFAVIIIMGLVIWGMSARIDIAEAQRDQYAAESKACQDNFKINKEVSNAYFQQNLDLRKRYDANRLRLRAACIPVSTASRVDATPVGGDVRANGIDAHALHDYGRDCGEIEHRLKGLQDWTSRVCKQLYND